MFNEMIDMSSMEDEEVDLALIMEKVIRMKTIKETTEFLKVLNEKEIMKKVFSNNLEKTFFNQLYDKVSTLFSRSDRINHNEDSVEEFEAFVSFLEFYEHSIEFSRSYDTCDRMLDPIEVSFKLIESSFSLYRDLGVDVLSAEPTKRSLDSIFERTVSLTKISVSLLDHFVKVDSTSNEDRIETIVNVCSTLKRICLLFETITSKPAISIWKCYTGILLKYSDRIGNRVKVVDACEEICRKINSLIENFKESLKRNEPNSVRSLQLCVFFCKILKAIFDKYRSHLSDAFPTLLRLILTVYGYSVTKLEEELSDSVVATIEVDVQVMVVVEHLTVQLLREKEFSSLVKNIQHSDVDDGNRVQICLFLLLVLENLTTLDDESLDILMDYGKEKSILDTFFKVFSKCSVPLSLPVYLKGVTIQGKPQRQIYKCLSSLVFQWFIHNWLKHKFLLSAKFVSFYEFVCTKFCSAVTIFPSRYFNKLELVLLQSLMSSNEMWRKLLAVDIWSYLGRLESSEMCYGHFEVIARIVDSMAVIPNCDAWCIVLLLRRLYDFLSIQQKLVFANKFSVDRHRTLWVSLLDAEIDDEVWNVFGGRQHLFRQSVEGLEKSFIETSPSPIATLQNMYFHLAFVTKLCSDSKISTSSKSTALNLSLRILTALPSEIDSPIVESVVSKLISLFGHLIPVFRNADLSEILPKLLHLYHNSCGQKIRLSILKFIKRLKRKNIENGEVSRHLSELLKSCLKEKNPIVLHHALDSFSAFSHETPNVQVISDCFSREPFLKDIVVNFLNQVPVSVPGCSGYEELVQSSLRQQQANINETNVTEPEENVKEDDKSEELYRNTIEEVKESVDKLVNALEVKETTTVPQWVGLEMEKILTKLNKAKNLLV